MKDQRDEIKGILVEELDNLRQRIIENHIRAGQKASGRTIASLRVEVNDDEGTLFGRQAFGVLETGRKPGKVPKGFNEIIKQWIIDKGISIKNIPYKRKATEKWSPKYTPKEKGLNTLAGAIAYKIKEEGTSLFNGGGRADIYSPEIERTIQDIMNRAFAIFEDDVTHINLNSNEDT